jgi:ubiquinone/menaquinone biosynthesis C-methylase UbiE
MLERIFVALSNLPGLKKRLWRSLYGSLSRWYRGADWTFMNYGYSSPEEAVLELATIDEPNRNWIHLYNQVAGAVDLQGRAVLEVGSGRGGGASFIKRYLRPDRMIGVDLSKNAVDLCRELHCIDGLEFRVGDAEHLPVEDDSVDAVVNVESSHCYPSFNRFLAEVRRVLRPGGHFLYADFRARTQVDGWRTSLKNSGLILLHETDITRNVLAALEKDNELKLAFINRVVPRFFRPAFLAFAGMRGTVLFEGFQSGTMCYKSFVLIKPV